jgi:hypothetical protein
LILRCIFILTIFYSKTIIGQPSIEFKDKLIDLGTKDYLYPDKINVEYIFYNKGNEPLTISSVVCSFDICVPNWDNKSIAPNDSSKIILYCDQNRPGKFWHTCTVTSNSKPESTTMITIKWEYLVPKDDK